MDTSLQKYQAFVLAVDTGSFSKAAEALSYSQSGISRMIGDLEQEWGVTLLERGKAGVKLTGDGTKLLPYARNLIREYESLRHAIDGLSGLSEGLIRLGVHLGFSNSKLSKMISDFSVECPGIDFEIKCGSYDQIEAWTRTGEVDLGFTALPVSAGLESFFIGQEELMALTSVRATAPLGIADFNDENFILFEAGDQKDVSQLLKKCKVSPKIKITSPDPGQVISLVASGAGLAILPEGTLENLPKKVFTASLDVPAFVNCGVCLKSRSSSSVAVKKFLEILSLQA